MSASGADAAVIAFDQVIDRTISAYGDEFESGFVAESPAKLRRLPQYYAALLGRAPFPDVQCNAPWVSIVIEADGAVRPCFFHDPIGNIRASSLQKIIASDLRAFRESFDVGGNAICRRCVCSIKTGWRHAPWLS